MFQKLDAIKQLRSGYRVAVRNGASLVAETDNFTESEFTALRRLLGNEREVIDEEAIACLIAKRYVRASDEGWVVTVDGHAAYLHELRRAFDG